MKRPSVYRMVMPAMMWFVLCLAALVADTKAQPSPKMVAGPPLTSTAKPWEFMKGPSEGMFAVMEKEIKRNMAKLRIQGSPDPYYMALAVHHNENTGYSYTLGAYNGRYYSRYSSLGGKVRVGSYRFDDSGYWSVYSWGRSRTIPFELNPLAVRRASYFVLDETYKRSVQQYSQKKAYLENKPKEERSDDWTREKPLVNVVKIPPVKFDLKPWHGTIRKASAVFRGYPAFQGSSVTIGAYAKSTQMLTSEGMRYFTPYFRIGVSISASTQSDDGRTYHLNWSKNVSDPVKLPAFQKVLEEAKKLADRLEALRKAPLLKEDFSGPVLFEGKAAAEVILATVGANLSANEPPATSTQPRIFEKMIGRKILPDWINVRDDPTLKVYSKKPLAGHYVIDDEGVKAQKIVLVNRGVIKGYLASRRPSKDTKRSNGHGRALWGDPLSVMAMPSNLFVLPRRALSKAALKSRYIAMLRKEGLKEGYIIRASHLASVASHSYWGARRFSLPQPILVYRVDLKGKETLVRGVMLGDLPINDLKRIAAMGGPVVVHNRRLGGTTGISVVTHSFILERIELNQARKAWTKNPILPSPLARK